MYPRRYAVGDRCFRRLGDELRAAVEAHRPPDELLVLRLRKFYTTDVYECDVRGTQRDWEAILRMVERGPAPKNVDRLDKIIWRCDDVRLYYVPDVRDLERYIADVCRVLCIYIEERHGGQ